MLKMYSWWERYPHCFCQEIDVFSCEDQGTELTLRHKECDACCTKTELLPTGSGDRARFVSSWVPGPQHRVKVDFYLLSIDRDLEFYSTRVQVLSFKSLAQSHL